MNGLRTMALLAAMTALFLGAGYLIGGGGGALVALGVAVAMNAFTFWNSDRVALWAHKAQPVTAMTHPDLLDMVADLSARAGIPTPRVYVMQSVQANAFATGRSPERGAVALTSALLNGLSRDEIAAVVAHELAHIKNRDTLIMTVAATFAGAISFLANIGFLLGGNRDRGQFGVVGVLIAVFLAPLAAALIQMTISRTREYAADRGAAEITGDPLALVGALKKIAHHTTWQKMETAEANPSTAHLFIANPLYGQRLDRLFSTHPPIARRIAALEAMAYEDGYRLPPRRKVRVRQAVSRIPKVLRR
ncbi:MAG: M48 family metalloprotease [Pseudomonadota bacterium]